MAVCYVYQDQYPWDIRVEKICGSLAAAGIPTTIFCRNRQRLRRRESLGENLQVRRLPRGYTSLDRALLNFPAFFSPTWIGGLLACVRRDRISLLIVRDLPLTPAALLVGKLTGVPVIMDMAENYPAMIRGSQRHGRRRPLDAALRNPRALELLEQASLPALAGVLVVTEASAQRVRRLTRAPVEVVGNTPRLGMATPDPDHPGALAMSAHPGPKLLYVGGMEHSRGLDVVIRALPLLPPQVKFFIIGEGAGKPALFDLAARLGAAAQVEFVGWVDQAAVPSFIAAADICLVPHRRTAHTETTMPNKIFDYMAQGKPVVVTQVAALRDLVDATGCGLYYQDGEPSDLARCVLSLIDNDQAGRLGENGRLAVQRRYNWAQDEKVLLRVVREHI